MEIKRRPRKGPPGGSDDLRLAMNALGDVVGLDLAGQVGQHAADCVAILHVCAGLEALEELADAADAAWEATKDSPDPRPLFQRLWDLKQGVKHTLELARRLGVLEGRHG